MPKKKSTRPPGADQESGAAPPSMVTGSAESSIDQGIEHLMEELSADSPAAATKPEPAPETRSHSNPPPGTGGRPDPVAETAPDSAPPAAGSERPKLPTLSPVEFAALGLISLIILGFVLFLFSIPDDDLPSSDDLVRASETVPSSAKGDLVTLDAIDAYWRPLTELDRTDKSSALLPELTLQVSQLNRSAPSFLKVYFLDPSGEISGDVRTARLEDGKLVDTGRGESVTAARQVSLYGSKGIKDKNAFLAYRYSGEDSWAIQIFEGADYSNGPWNSLAFFKIPNEIRGELPSE